MKIQPILNAPACMIEDILVVSDLHIGIERAYREEGIRLPPQTKKILKRIEGLWDKNDAQEIIVLGDLKNQVPELSWQERKEIPNFLKKLAYKGDVTIVPGNHDGNINKLVPEDSDEIKIEDSSGFSRENVYLLHGHAWPRRVAFDESSILIGHNHPIIRFEDELDRRHDEKCWIRTKLNKEKIIDHYGGKINWNNPEVIIQPAFNELVGGIPFNGSKKDFLGPLFNSRSISYQEMRANLIDGTHLGKVNKLEKMGFKNQNH